MKKPLCGNEVKDKLNSSGLSPLAGSNKCLCIARGVGETRSLVVGRTNFGAGSDFESVKIEELINELKEDYTIAIVTHNMQQAARCSDYTAYMYLGELVEFGETDHIFMNPVRKETQDYITGRFG